MCASAPPVRSTPSPAGEARTAARDLPQPLLNSDRRCDVKQLAIDGPGAGPADGGDQEPLLRIGLVQKRQIFEVFVSRRRKLRDNGQQSTLRPDTGVGGQQQNLRQRWLVASHLTRSRRTG